MNRVMLVGRITRDPELRTTNSNVSVCTFTIAVNRPFTSNVTGQREADFINCIVFNKQAENLNRYIRKGGLLGVEGRIQTRSYTHQDGSQRYVTEVLCDSVHFLEPKGSSSNNTQSYDDYSPYDVPRQAPSRKESNPFEDLPSRFDVTDDDLPF